MTPRYCSPEFFKEKEINLKFDIWSIGCVILYLFTGIIAYDKVSQDVIGDGFTTGSTTQTILEYFEKFYPQLYHDLD